MAETYKFRRDDGGWGIAPDDITFSVAAGNGSAMLSWSQPEKTVVNGQVICHTKGIMLRRSETAIPATEHDGTLLLDTENLTGTYEDTGLTNGKTYYYKAFPYSDHQVYNRGSAGESISPSAGESVVVNFTADTAIPKAVVITCTDLTDSSQTMSQTITAGSTSGQANFTVPVNHKFLVTATALDKYEKTEDPAQMTAGAGHTTTIVYTYTYKPAITYAFHINGKTSVPGSMITYPSGVDNSNFRAFAMNLTTGVPDYGDWKDAFFMPRPCMLKSDGSVDYYLDVDDYTKKEDGKTASDVTNTAYDGNAMMEWGPGGDRKIWYKIVPDSGDDSSATVYFSDYQQDDNYHAWSFYDANDHLTAHFYTPIYNGSLISNKLRSLSGQPVMNSKAASDEISAAQRNNPSGKAIWYTEVLADVILINLLMILISKTTDTQTAFGYGHYNNGSSASDLDRTGSRDKNGLFYGTSGNVPNKVFGMENWFAMQWRRYAGHIAANGVQKIKLTYGKADGSTVSGYNTTGEGYLTISGSKPTGNSGGYISKMKFDSKGMMLPVAANGSTTTYYCDVLYYDTGNATGYAFRGGASDAGLACGAFASRLYAGPSHYYWVIGAALSCKPLAS